VIYERVRIVERQFSVEHSFETAAIDNITLHGRSDVSLALTGPGYAVCHCNNKH
jgi:hypothetical protein